jgi:hypothetical protein
MRHLPALVLLASCTTTEPEGPELPITGVAVLRHRLATGTENDSLVVHAMRDRTGWAEATLDPVAALARNDQIHGLPEGGFAAVTLGQELQVQDAANLPAAEVGEDAGPALLVGDRWQAYLEGGSGVPLHYRTSPEEDLGGIEGELGALTLSWDGGAT